MKRHLNITAAILFGIFAVSLVYVALTGAPSRELTVIRAVLSHWQSELGGVDPLANVLLISNPSKCHISDNDVPVSEEVLGSFLGANREQVRPIPLSRLADLVAVVDVQEARRWRGQVFRINAGDYSLVGVSRVGFSDGQALLCIESRNLGNLVLLELSESGWSVVESHPAWTS